MISGINIKAMQELQMIMEQHGKEIAESLKAFQDFSNGLSQSLKSLSQFGINVSKTLEETSNRLSKSLEPVYDIMESIQKNAVWFKNIDASSFKVAIKGLKELQEKMISMPIEPINISPSLLISPVRDDKRLKNLIKEAIRELEEEESRRRKQELEELSKKRKIGFGD